MRRIALFLFALSIPFATFAQENLSDSYTTAVVTEISSEVHDEVVGYGRTLQIVRLTFEDGTTRTIEHAALDGREDTLLQKGDRVVIERIVRSDGSEDYLIREPYRLRSVLAVLGAFFILAALFAGWTGAASIVGLFVSIGILAFYVVPSIGNGGNPLFASFTGSVAIACTSLYLAHGFNKRTSVALLSTLTTLAIALVLSVVAVGMTKLFGMGSEESMFLQLGTLQAVNLRGLLLGGIVIGALGVLDDITTAQTAVIGELKRANPRMSRAALYRSGLVIGREHIASLVNTLALAYAGASLPLLLLFWSGPGAPWWVVLNSESLVEEIIRTLVGSMTLILAVPISTWFACRFLSGADASDGLTHHRHS